MITFGQIRVDSYFLHNGAKWCKISSTSAEHSIGFSSMFDKDTFVTPTVK